MAVSKIKKQDQASNPTGLGTYVGITNYSSKAGAYNIPSDGLIWVQSRYSSGNYIGVTVCNEDGTNERAVQIGGTGAANISTMFPVFKGMKAWVSSNNGQNNFADFIPYKYD